MWNKIVFLDDLFKYPWCYPSFQPLSCLSCLNCPQLVPTPTVIFCSVDRISDCLLNSSLYPVQLSGLTKEASLCSGWQLISRLGTNQVQRTSVDGVFGYKRDICITPTPLKAQGTLRKRRREDCKSQRSGRTGVKLCLLNVTISVLTAALVACKAQTR